MRSRAQITLFALLGASLLFGTCQALAQGRGGGPRRGFDREAFRQRMMERLQSALEASDEEWKVIQPLLADVMAKQREAARSRLGGMFLFAGRGRAGGERGDRGRRGMSREMPKEVTALQKALENKDTPPTEIAARLKALREYRQAKQKALQAARDKLRRVLSARQEAQLVLMGFLD